MVPPIHTSCTLFSKPIWHSKTQTQGGDKGKEIKAGCPQHLPTFGSILILYKMKVGKRIISMSSFTLKCPRAEIIEGVLAEVFLSSVTLDHCAVCSCAIIKGSLCLEGYPLPSFNPKVINCRTSMSSVGHSCENTVSREIYLAACVLWKSLNILH